jgi:RNA polymerase sigma-70 factor (ECF subfamily)
VITGRSSSDEPFESFYRREYAATVAIARGLLGSGAPAEDLAQECFVAAHRNWDRISGYEDPKGWLRRVLVNRATSFHRRRVVEWKAMARVGIPDEALPEISPQATEVWDEVRRLPTRQAQVTVLHYVDQMSVDEIAAVLGCSPGAVKSHLHRARTRLGERLSGLEEATR